jgi:hypothetical protein
MSAEGAPAPATSFGFHVMRLADAPSALGFFLHPIPWAVPKAGAFRAFGPPGLPGLWPFNRLSGPLALQSSSHPRHPIRVTPTRSNYTSNNWLLRNISYSQTAQIRAARLSAGPQTTG